MERCIVKEKIKFANLKQAAIYNHNKHESKLLIETSNGKSSEIISGKGVQVFDSNATVSCQSNDCLITIWLTSYDVNKSFFVSDGAGCSISCVDKIFDDFWLFFDFGENARLSVEEFNHKREAGLIFYNETGPIVFSPDYLSTRKSLDISGPRILKISYTTYQKAIVNITVGSIIKIPKSFSNNPVYHSFYRYSNGEIDTTDYQSNVKVFPASEARSWYYLSIVMCALTGILFIASIVSISIICTSYRKNK